jgi:hypothetical protein
LGLGVVARGVKNGMGNGKEEREKCKGEKEGKEERERRGDW